MRYLYVHLNISQDKFSNLNAKHSNVRRLHLAMFLKNNVCFAYYCITGAQNSICHVEGTK